MNIVQKYFESLKLEELGVSLLSKGISLLLLFIFFAIGKRIIDFLFKHTIERSIKLSRQAPARQKTITKLLQNILNYALYFLLIYWTLSILGLPISSLLAGAGLAGLAIGLGAQGFLSDVVNGFFILLENQYDVGDSVEIGAVTGKISSVGIRTTQVRGFDGTLHFIPNRNILVVSNKSRGDMRAQIDLPIYSWTNLEQMTTVIKEVSAEKATDYPDLVGSPDILGLKTTPNGQLIFRIDIFCQNGSQNKVYSDFYQFYQEALLAAGIELANTMTMATNKISK